MYVVSIQNYGIRTTFAELTSTAGHFATVTSQLQNHHKPTQSIVIRIDYYRWGNLVLEKYVLRFTNNIIYTNWFFWKYWTILIFTCQYNWIIVTETHVLTNCVVFLQIHRQKEIFLNIFLYLNKNKEIYVEFSMEHKKHAHW